MAMRERWVDKEWFYWIRLSLKVALAVGALYLGYHFYERHRIANFAVKPEPKRIELPADIYAFVPKSYVSDLESARRKLVGNPLWIKEGYRWIYQPGDRLFGPLERIVPQAVKVVGSEVQVAFEKDGQQASFGIGSPERVFIDEIFFVKDPKEIYDHWTDEMWRKAERGEVEVGMSEIQIGFALGVGQAVRQSGSAALRIVEYRACREAGLDPVRVTYRRHVAESIEPLGS